MRKKRLLANVGGVVVVLLVLAYTGNRPGHIPLYDANLVRLAETQRQGYCAGVTFWETGGAGEAGLARECRAAHLEESGRVNLLKAEEGFCRGIIDGGWEGYIGACLEIMAGNQYWPTYNGTITDQWNRARPYPRPALGSTNEENNGSRTGDRPGGGRSDPSSRSPDSYPYGGAP